MRTGTFCQGREFRTNNRVSHLLQVRKYLHAPIKTLSQQLWSRICFAPLVYQLNLSTDIVLDTLQETKKSRELNKDEIDDNMSEISTQRTTAKSTQDVKRKFFDTMGPDSTDMTSQVRADGVLSNVGGFMNPYMEPIRKFEERLKYDRFTESDHEPKLQAEGPVRRPKKKKKKSLTFHETVQVVPIPMRTEYSNWVRSRLWTSAIELQQNARRNTIEFLSEGWNWRNVLEDDKMYICIATSERSHPCHYHQNMAFGS